MDPKKGPASPRLVWRMTADAPMGEYLELVPKSAYDMDNGAAAPKRVLHPEVRDPIFRTSLQASTTDGATATASTTAGPSLLERRSAPRTATPSAPSAPPTPTAAAGSSSSGAQAERQQPPAAPRARVLNPGQVPSWRASSYDLLTGCTVRDVSDTIPGEIFDELFRSNGSAPRAARRRR